MAATPRGVQLKLKEHSYRESLLVWREDKRAAIPRRRGSECIGYDLCTVDECTLIPGVMSFVSTGLVMRVPDGHYGRLASHPESLELGIDVLNGVVEPDSRAVVRVAIINRTASAITIPTSTVVALLVLERASAVAVFEAVGGIDQLSIRQGNTPRLGKDDFLLA